MSDDYTREGQDWWTDVDTARRCPTCGTRLEPGYQCPMEHGEAS